jgi:hypothetical protein
MFPAFIYRVHASFYFTLMNKFNLPAKVQGIIIYIVDVCPTNTLRWRMAEAYSRKLIYEFHGGKDVWGKRQEKR